MQGGQLSARLFSIYIEDVIEEVNKINIRNILNIVLYAADILILTETKAEMQKTDKYRWKLWNRNGNQIQSV